MNSRFLRASGLNEEVEKMVNVFGDPIDQTDSKIIVDYLKEKLRDVTQAGGSSRQSSLRSSSGRSHPEFSGWSCASGADPSARAIWRSGERTSSSRCRRRRSL